MLSHNTKEKLENLLKKYLAENNTYLEALGIVRRNSEGKTWLIGSGVYKTLLNKLYNETYVAKDWDFIVEKIALPIKLDDSWELAENKHGNPKLTCKDFTIDLIDLNNIHSIKERGLEPNINNYLTGTPLTI